MRRAMGRGRRGPGLLGTAARTAVVAGTATAVSGRVATAQQMRQPAAESPAGAPSAPVQPPADGRYYVLPMLAMWTDSTPARAPSGS